MTMVKDKPMMLYKQGTLIATLAGLLLLFSVHAAVYAQGPELVDIREFSDGLASQQSRLRGSPECSQVVIETNADGERVLKIGAAGNGDPIVVNLEKLPHGQAGDEMWETRVSRYKLRHTVSVKSPDDRAQQLRDVSIGNFYEQIDYLRVDDKSDADAQNRRIRCRNPSVTRLRRGGVRN